MTISIDALKKKLKELQTKNPVPRKIIRKNILYHAHTANSYNNDIMKKLKNSYRQN